MQSVVTRLWAGHVRNCGSVPRMGKRSVLKMSRLILVPTQPLIQRVPVAVSPGVKWLGCKANRSSPSSLLCHFLASSIQIFLFRLIYLCLFIWHY